MTPGARFPDEDNSPQRGGQAGSSVRAMKRTVFTTQTCLTLRVTREDASTPDPRPVRGRRDRLDLGSRIAVGEIEH